VAKHQSPRVINVDQNRSYPPAVEELTEVTFSIFVSQHIFCNTTLDIHISVSAEIF
jgi:hypothetical protein